MDGYVWMLLLLASLAGAAHECERPCLEGDNRICTYEFNLQEYYTMGRACFDCPTNQTDCSRDECVAGDGVSRPVLTVNRQLPGPAIQVCEGDRVLVDVFNHQLSDTESIHWHGMHMQGQQYQDGVPYITQCPILAGAYRYDFVANTPGTHWWHSHTGLHRGSGVFGPLVVRQANDPHLGSYDVDSNILVVQDWIHTSVMAKFTGKHYAALDNHASAILINGKGRSSDGEESATPLEVVQVTSGLRYRLRIINAGGLNCPIIMSVDNHQLTIIATDGDPVIPFTTDSLVTYSGERFDVILEANQPLDNYWIRFNGLVDCKQNECVQGAVLRYEGAPENDPAPELSFDPTYPPGIVVNPLNSGGNGVDEITLVHLDSFEPSILSDPVDKQFYLAFDFNEVNNTLLYNPDLYPYNGVSKEWQIHTPQINDLSFVSPTAPPLSQPLDPQPTICRYGETPPCSGDYCSCTYVLEVALGETVEMVLVDEGSFFDANHPFHLHGYNFHVVAMDRLGSETSLEEVSDLDASGGITRKLQNAAKKDTVTLQDGGYTIIRFTANNPGWWLMHCHLVFHSSMGMEALLHVGTPEDLPTVPTGFPTCGPYVPPL